MIKTYSRKSDGETSLSENFKVAEFACKDGSDKILIDSDLVCKLQHIRDYYKAPITINSGYRSPSYNKKIGGAKASQHMKGTAADINVKGITPGQLYSDIDSGKVFGKSHDGGLGKYPGFVHIDTGAKRRW